MKKYFKGLLLSLLVILCPLLAGPVAINEGFNGEHSFSINADDVIYAWGNNDCGQLGINSTENSNVPVAVNMKGVLSDKTIISISAGYKFTLALASDGTVYSWGRNNQGQLGNNSNINSSIPVAVDMTGVLSGKTIIEIAAGVEHSFALASDGTIYSWGYNYFGELGNNNPGVNTNIPIAVDMSGVLSGKTINKIDAGCGFSVALASDGAIYCWGRNHSGQLGNHTMHIMDSSPVPVAVDMSGVLSGKTITQISAGSRTTLVLTSDGMIYGWGDNDFGQLGNEPTADRDYPIAADMSDVLSGKTIIDIDSGDTYSLALDSDGKVYSWGLNWDGQLGINSTEIRHFPIAVESNGILSGKTIIKISGNKYHSMVLASDGAIYCWGCNKSGQLGINSTATNSLVPVQVVNSNDADQALPIELSQFSADAINGVAILNWTTESELENLGFVLERKLKGEGSWQEIANYANVSDLKGHGTTSMNHSYGYTDNTVLPGTTYLYRLGDMDYSNNITWHETLELTLEQEDITLAGAFGLQTAFPNPFNPSVNLGYSLSQDGDISLGVYDLNGKLVNMLISQFQHAGSYHYNWQPQNLSTGIYIVRFQSGNLSDFQKIAFVK